MKKEESPLTNLTKLFVLSLLSKPIHGYGLMKVFEARTGKRLSPGQLYPLLKRMERNGLVKHEDEYQGNRKRKVYTLTDKGSKKRKELKERLESIIY